MEIIDDQPESVEPEPELDGQRIRQLAALRRGAIRARSWCLITAGVCLVGAIQLVIFSVQLIRAPGSAWLRIPCYLMVAAAGLWLTVYFLRRARVLKREIGRSALGQPETSPDFSQLSDGSQRWKNLEDIR
jgi:ABC-type nickel/cobalt efflux system permease component RcnA